MDISGHLGSSNLHSTYKVDGEVVNSGNRVEEEVGVEHFFLTIGPLQWNLNHLVSPRAKASAQGDIQSS